ncbi:Glu/Leu/Phe/Val dehydrogenase [Candidatus Saccharibacteria bacterium]|nr:Glu/Leu/Phe/Val dehydrogenase [Candidatus Saccharibacteria bacterium]
MLEATHSFIKQIGKKLNLSEQGIDRLLKPDAEHNFDIELKSGQKFKAYRVQHSNKLGPYKGGIRFHQNVNLDEIRALAILMSLKTAAVGLPLGGAKGGVAVNPKELSRAELEEISRQYVRHLVKFIGPDKDIPAPDVNTDQQIIDWMADEYERLTKDKSHASFTGKSLHLGGSEGREAATGRGGVIASARLFQHLGKPKQKLTYAVQGYGNVGSFFATIAQKEQPDWQMVAASDSRAAVYDPSGLDAKELADYKNSGKSFSDFRANGTRLISNEALISLDTDVLVLAALEDALTESNAPKVKAKYIVELANGPINEAAYQYLTHLRQGSVGQASQPVTILPDIIANAGGVIVSYLEWLQNKAGEHWPETKVNAELKKYMVKAVDHVYKSATSQNLSLKEAALAIALKRLTT